MLGVLDKYLRRPFIKTQKPLIVAILVKIATIPREIVDREKFQIAHFSPYLVKLRTSSNSWSRFSYVNIQFCTIRTNTYEYILILPRFRVFWYIQCIRYVEWRRGSVILTEQPNIFRSLYNFAIFDTVFIGVTEDKVAYLFFSVWKK